MKSIFKSILIIGLLVSTNAFAATNKNAWRECGIGALIFSGTPWAAVTSNIIWDLGLTGSTSSSSSPSQCAGRGASVARFIYENYAVIEEQTAIGKGSHLIAMLNILDCKAVNQPSILNNVRKDFSNDIKASNFPMLKTNEKAEQYYYNVIKRAEESKSCASQVDA